MNRKKNTTYVTEAEALAKLQKYCAYQDRCHQEVRTKLLDLGIYGDTLEEIISELIGDNFLNEERYARSFARGKFRIKSWGKNRIIRELKQRKISDYCIKKALTEIDADDYNEKLQAIIEKKSRTLKEENSYKRKIKLATFAIRKGFESELVWRQLNKTDKP